MMNGISAWNAVVNSKKKMVNEPEVQGQRKSSPPQIRFIYTRLNDVVNVFLIDMNL